jgi:pyridoxamine 5'-phosphate oxidase-like protein
MVTTDRPHMPGYGLAPADGGRGLLPWSWADERLRDARGYWLATAGADGRPHVAAVWGLWWRGALHVSTGGRSRKARDIARNPLVAVGVDGTARSLTVDGVADRVTDPAVEADVARDYRAKYGEGFPDPAENPLFAIRPRTVIAVVEEGDDFTELATRWRFDPGEVPPGGP